MVQGLLSMSVAERERAAAMRQIAAETLTQKSASERLGLSLRQVKRLYRLWRDFGDAGLVSRQRGRVSPLRLDEKKRFQIATLLRSDYPDFGATLAAEKLSELHGINVSRETVRRIQIDLGLAKAKRRRSVRVHAPRARRPRFGELVQIDGSPHDWFEGRGPRCTLIVFIDDATSRLTSLHFAPSETTRAYLEALRAHVLANGRPMAFYSDRHGIFRVNMKESAGGDGFTEFGRVAERLRIELIQASTPQAKGRVERANQTLQDRLIKEMRLRGISSLASAQAFTAEFIGIWNARFAKPPMDPADAHRPWTGSEATLDELMARRETRTLSKALTFSTSGKGYCINPKGPGIALRGALVTLLHFRDGGMLVRYKDRDLPYTCYKSLPSGSGPSEDEKTLDVRMENILAHTSSAPAQGDILTLL